MAANGDGRALLDSARDDYLAGSVGSAWESVLTVASMARRVGDAELLADAALLVDGPIIGAWDLAGQRHALCLEALDLISNLDPVRAERLRTMVAVTVSPWHSTPKAVVMDRATTDARSRELHARHAAAIGASGVHSRLRCAVELAEVAASTHRLEDAAWASLWQLDAYAQLGRRIELNAELMRLAAHVRELGSLLWSWRLAAARASVALLDCHLDDVPSLAAEALAYGTEAGVEDAIFVDVVLRARFCVQTRTGLAEIEPEVRHVLSGAPFFAHGWHAEILLAQGRASEAFAIWRALAPRVHEFPKGSIEWLIAMAGYADICVAADDRVTAPFLIDALTPFADQHAAGGIMTPYEGPVALFLGRLAELMGDHTAARDYFVSAAELSDRAHAPFFAGESRLALEGLRESAGLLTLRESDVACLVADGLTNRQIAARLHLSERTVENHVSSILRKLDLGTRTAVAARVGRRP